MSLARADFMACLDLLEDRKAGWSEELAPAEVAGCLVLSWLMAGNEASALAALPRAERFAEESPVSSRFLAAVRDVLAARESGSCGGASSRRCNWKRRRAAKAGEPRPA